MFGLASGSLGYNLVLSGFIFIGTNTVGFLITTFTKTHKITDIIGCGSFSISAWATYIAATRGNDIAVGAYHRPLFLTIAATFWSVRLAGFLFYRILQTGTDARFDNFYNAPDEPWLTGPTKFPLKLMAFWVVQAAWGWLVLLPVTAAQAAQPTANMGAWGWIGGSLFMFFWAYEFIADVQKDYFKRQPGNKKEFIKSGLYYFSQFPNYFAEIATWWSMYLWAGIPHVARNQWWIIASPLFTTVLLRWGSGVATLAASQKERYGSRQDFQEYIACTPLLFPFMKPLFAGRKPPSEALMGAQQEGTTGDSCEE